MEEWIHTWHAKKLDKYQELLDNKAEDWNIIRLAIEVGSRGFIPPSLGSALRKLGFSSLEISTLRKKCSLMAQRCSYAIFLNRSNADFKPWRYQDI